MDRNLPKDHHYVPNAYLKFFKGEDGFLRIFDWACMSFIKPKSPKKWPTKKHFYTHINVEGQLDVTIELKLGELIETPYPKALNRIIKTGTLTNSDKIVLSRFFATQFVRTPYHRNWFKREMEYRMKTYANTDMEDIRKRSNVFRNLDEDVWKLIQRKFREDFSRYTPSQIEYLQHLCRLSDGVAEALYNQNWLFLRIKDAHTRKFFVTSDDPFNIAPPEGSDRVGISAPSSNLDLVLFF